MNKTERKNLYKLIQYKYGIDPKEVIDQVEKQYELRSGSILSKNRSEYVYLARREVIAIFRLRGMSAMNIGRILNRNHSTILHAMELNRNGNK